MASAVLTTHSRSGGARSPQANMPFALHVTFRREELTLSLDDGDPSLDEVGAAIAQRVGVPLETLKLLVTGRRGPPLQPAAMKGMRASETGALHSPVSLDCCKHSLGLRHEDKWLAIEAPATAGTSWGLWLKGC